MTDISDPRGMNSVIKNGELSSSVPFVLLSVRMTL